MVTVIYMVIFFVSKMRGCRIRLPQAADHLPEICLIAARLSVVAVGRARADNLADLGMTVAVAAQAVAVVDS
jgi:hypothetical protein